MDVHVRRGARPGTEAESKISQGPLTLVSCLNLYLRGKRSFFHESRKERKSETFPPLFPSFPNVKMIYLIARMVSTAKLQSITLACPSTLRGVVAGSQSTELDLLYFVLIAERKNNSLLCKNATHDLQIWFTEKWTELYAISMSILRLGIKWDELTGWVLYSQFRRTANTKRAFKHKKEDLGLMETRDQNTKPFERTDPCKKSVGKAHLLMFEPKNSHGINGFLVESFKKCLDFSAIAVLCRHYLKRKSLNHWNWLLEVMMTNTRKHQTKPCCAPTVSGRRWFSTSYIWFPKCRKFIHTNKQNAHCMPSKVQLFRPIHIDISFSHCQKKSLFAMSFCKDIGVPRTTGHPNGLHSRVCEKVIFGSAGRHCESSTGPFIQRRWVCHPHRLIRIAATFADVRLSKKKAVFLNLLWTAFLLEGFWMHLGSVSRSILRHDGLCSTAVNVSVLIMIKSLSLKETSFCTHSDRKRSLYATLRMREIHTGI